VIEPRVGGGWYERGDDGSTCDRGSVLAWEPSTRLVLSWDVTADWKYDPALKTQTEVRFMADAQGGTRVELEGRHLDRCGARRDEMRRIFAGEGWTRLLDKFAEAAAASERLPEWSGWQDLNLQQPAPKAGPLPG
jgi:uncharacterized protein YndB with AHSA1/START domain